MNKTFSITECFSVGWTRFKEHPWFFVAFSLFLWGVAGVNGYLTDVVYANIEPTRSFLDLLFSVLYYWIMFGFIVLTLRSIDHQSLDFDQLLKIDRRFIIYLIGLILYGVMVLVGLLALVIPGIYLAIRYGFFWYGIIDGNKGVMESFQESARITDGVKWQMVLFGMACIGVIFLGMLCLGIGVLVAMPVTMLASAHLYRVLLSQSQISSQPLVPSTPLRTEGETPNGVLRESEVQPAASDASTPSLS